MYEGRSSSLHLATVLDGSARLLSTLMEFYSIFASRGLCIVESEAQHRRLDIAKRATSRNDRLDAMASDARGAKARAGVRCPTRPPITKASCLTARGYPQHFQVSVTSFFSYYGGALS